MKTSRWPLATLVLHMLVSCEQRPEAPTGYMDLCYVGDSPYVPDTDELRTCEDGLSCQEG